MIDLIHILQKIGLGTIPSKDWLKVVWIGNIKNWAQMDICLFVRSEQFGLSEKLLFVDSDDQLADIILLTQLSMPRVSLEYQHFCWF